MNTILPNASTLAGASFPPADAARQDSVAGSRLQRQGAASESELRKELNVGILQASMQVSIRSGDQSQALLFRFTPEASRLCALAVGATSLLMVFFRPAEFETAKNRVSALMVLPLQVMGRYTLEIYVLHLLAFKAVAAYYGYQNHGFFEWAWIR